MAGAARRTMATCLLLAGLTALVAGGMAQGFDDPRNTDPRFYDAVNGAACYAHHETQGFQAMGFSFERRYTQLPIGEEVPIKIVVRHNSQKVQQIQSISVVVNNSHAPNVVVLSNATVPDIEETLTHTLTHGEAPLVRQVEIVESASDVYVSARLRERPTGSDLPGYEDLPSQAKGEFTLKVGPVERRVTVEGPTPYERVFRADRDEIRGMGQGRWAIEASWSSQLDAAMTLDLYLAVNHTTDATEFLFRHDETLLFRGAKTTVEIPVVMKSAEEAVLDFRIQSVSYWPHDATDGAFRDDGLFYRFMTMKVRGGDEAVILSGSSAPNPVPPAVDLYNLFARLIGLLTLFLVPLAMVSGGLFGKSSRRWLNRMTGGARKRVLWHSSTSFLILGVATLHFVLALVERQFVWTRGLLWGGAGWLLLLSLGFTGYFQARMIKRWNYRVWRHTHLWSAVGVFAFGLVHMALDGSDFDVVRDAFPWLNRLVWP